MTGEVVGEGPESLDIETDEILFSSDFSKIESVQRTDDDSGIDRLSVVLGYEDEDGEPIAPIRHYTSYDEFMLPIIRIPSDWVVTEVAPGDNPLRDLARRLWYYLEVFEVPVVKETRGAPQGGRGRGRAPKAAPSARAEAMNYWYRSKPDPETGLRHWAIAKDRRSIPRGIPESDVVVTPYQLGSANKVFLEWQLPVNKSKRRPRPIVKANYFDFTEQQRDEVEPLLRPLAPVQRGREVEHPERKIFWGTNKMFDLSEGEYWPNNFPANVEIKAGDLLAGFRYAHPKPGHDDKIGLVFKITPEFFKMMAYIFQNWMFPELGDTSLLQSIEYRTRFDDELDKMALTYQRAILMVREILSDSDLSEEAYGAFEEVLDVLLHPIPPQQKQNSKQ